MAHGVRRAHRSDTLGEILASPERDAWLDWLRTRRMAVLEAGWLCVHAGVVPAWSTQQTLLLAAEVEALLAGPDLPAFLRVMYGNEPAPLARRSAGGRPLALRHQHADAHPLLHRRRRELELDTKDGAGAGAAGLPSLVRSARPRHRRPAHRLWPLEHAGPDRPRRTCWPSTPAACGAARLTAVRVDWRPARRWCK